MNTPPVFIASYTADDADGRAALENYLLKRGVHYAMRLISPDVPAPQFIRGQLEYFWKRPVVYLTSAAVGKPLPSNFEALAGACDYATGGDDNNTIYFAATRPACELLERWEENIAHGMDNAEALAEATTTTTSAKAGELEHTNGQ